ncbi:MAG TPA: diphthine synthase [Candidatus Nanoarchaeia archaeon]|nr:diphthine synthase [Candidatus Nanoarchaeia archaeon]
MLYLIGIGLGNEKDITLNALETLKKCDFIYLENYTSKLNFNIKDFEKLIGKTIILADRELVESGDDIVNSSLGGEVAFLVKGDVFSATTHVDIYLRVKKLNGNCKVLHNSSILTAVGDTGLSLYKFGKTASIPFNYKNIHTPFDIYLENGRMHTLFLLDLDPKTNKYMNFKDGLNCLNENGDGSVNLGTYAVVCAGLGTDEQIIKYGKIEDLLKININIYPQCFIIPKDLHFMEEEFLNLYKI